ncbi:unnamed protein product, partial [Tetraodon nigroviridis]
QLYGAVGEPHHVLRGQRVCGGRLTEASSAFQ